MESGAYGAAKAGGSFDLQRFLAQPQVLARAASLVSGGPARGRGDPPPGPAPADRRRGRWQRPEPRGGRRRAGPGPATPPPHPRLGRPRPAPPRGPDALGVGPGAEAGRRGEQAGVLPAVGGAGQRRDRWRAASAAPARAFTWKGLSRATWGVGGGALKQDLLSTQEWPQVRVPATVG